MTIHLSDIAIAQNAELQPIQAIVKKLGLSIENIEPYGHYKAKINPIDVFAKPAKAKHSKLILVTAINPTPAGEGKTTVTIGLADALNRVHQQRPIRRPSRRGSDLRAWRAAAPRRPPGSRR